MHPVLFEVELAGSTVGVPAYGTFLVLAATLGLLLGARVVVDLGVSRSAALAGLGLAIGAGLVTARSLAVALDWGAYATEPSAITSLAPRGFALYGGLAGASIVALLLARRWRLPLGRLADGVIPAVAGGLVLMKIGCFLNGCCAGRETALPWGVRFPFGGTSWGTQVLDGRIGLFELVQEPNPVHPTQLYEVGTVLVAAIAALTLSRRSDRPGSAALVFLALAAGSRAGLQLLREPLPSASLPPWVEPLVYGGLALVALAALTATALGGRVAPLRRLTTTGRPTT